jgi:hypothetical protein
MQSARQMVFNRKRRSRMAKAALLLFGCFVAITIITSLCELAFPMTVDTVMQIRAYHTHTGEIILVDDDGEEHIFVDTDAPKEKLRVGRLVMVEFVMAMTDKYDYTIMDGIIRWDVVIDRDPAMTDL